MNIWHMQKKFFKKEDAKGEEEYSSMHPLPRHMMTFFVLFQAPATTQGTEDQGGTRTGLDALEKTAIACPCLEWNHNSFTIQPLVNKKLFVTKNELMGLGH
jgi:hypothetical protein